MKTSSLWEREILYSSNDITINSKLCREFNADWIKLIKPGSGRPKSKQTKANKLQNTLSPAGWELTHQEEETIHQGRLCYDKVYNIQVQRS
jgi:hypothetical protein